MLGPEVIEHMFGDVRMWGPGVLSIALALAVVLASLSPRIPDHTLLDIGLVFEVIASFGIATAEYSMLYAPMQYRPGDFGGLGLSWVAVWMLLFTIVVPTPPRKALVAAILSASAVPLTLARTFATTAELALRPTPMEFFTAFVLPYLIVVLMAYVGARVVYRLGTDVSHARELGSYRLTQRLGQGGMGEVWRGRHRLLARPAAIKLVDPALLGAADPGARATMVARFEREAQTTAAMRSPHTVEIFDFGRTDEGTFYYVMELLEGYDLQTLVERFGPVPAERAIHLLTQVCHSLGEAHEHGLIHRDIKPANLYTCRYGREVDFMKVLDFGLVKARDRPDAPDLTMHRFAGGTPAHMAPEQAVGDGVVDARTDIYSLGCVAYWLLTGHLVFDGESPLAMIADHARTPPAPPSEKTELEIPAALERVVMRCLEKDPGRRPATADDVAAELAACDVARTWTKERALEWWELHGPPREAVEEVTASAG